MRAEGLSFISTTASSCRASIPCLATGESKLSDNVNVGYFGSSDNGTYVQSSPANGLSRHLFTFVLMELTVNNFLFNEILCY